MEPKTARARRVVVLPEVASSALRAHRKRQAEERLLVGAEYQDHGFVFATTFGSPLDPANLYRTFKGLLQAAELDDFRVYDLRHTCATLLLLAGENPKVVSERLGHASVTDGLRERDHREWAVRARAAGGATVGGFVLPICCRTRQNGAKQGTTRKLEGHV